jgi:hypothetical protein
VWFANHKLDPEAEAIRAEWEHAESDVS